MDSEPKDLSAQGLARLKALRVKTERAKIFAGTEDQGWNFVRKITSLIEQGKSGTLTGYAYSTIVTPDMSYFERWRFKGWKELDEHYDPNGKVESYELEEQKALRRRVLQELGFMNEKGLFFPDVDLDLHINQCSDAEGPLRKIYYARSTTIASAWLVRQMSPFVLLGELGGRTDVKLLEIIMYGHEGGIRTSLSLPGRT